MSEGRSPRASKRASERTRTMCGGATCRGRRLRDAYGMSGRTYGPGSPSGTFSRVMVGELQS